MGYVHWCPACQCAHIFKTVEDGKRPRWTFDGNLYRPTFSPSMRIYVPAHRHGDGTETPEQTICHYFVRDGYIEFCGDSPHEFAGKKVPLPTLSEVGDYGWPI
jgi:hypothetical protein